jgi:predicted O-methyltransferase YrrM
VWLLIAISFLGIIGLAVATTEEVTVRGTVLEHNVTSDKHGKRTYSTIVRSDDGFIDEVIGLDVYIIPVGDKVTYAKKMYKSVGF